jgi:rhodanese-related sulfurtransferase
MIKKIILLLCLLLVTIAPLCLAGQDENISGEIVTGYRVLPIDPTASDIDLAVYRGDYIKFSYPEQFGKLNFAMPAMKYKGKILPDPDKSEFFKMKEIGTFPFTLGKAAGRITVVELIRPNYTPVTAAQAVEILENLHPFILDVRTPKEYRQTHIKGSYLIPIQQLQARIGELESKKYEDIFIYCATGNRSTVAARILADLGFKRIYNLRYGLHDWVQAGYPYTTSE